MSPSSPALRSSPAQAVIRWSAASTSSGGSSRPISAALPESSAHRSTRAVRAAFSRRPGLTQREGELVAGELVYHGGHLPGGWLEAVLGIAAEQFGDGDQ